MSHSNCEETFLEMWGEIRDLSATTEILEWDQETHMPRAGQAGRGRVLETLAGIRHSKLTSSELADALSAYEEEAEPGSVGQAQAREARRLVERATRIPTELAKRGAAASSSGLAAWQEARKADDFSLFQEELTAMVGIAREWGGHLAPLTESGDAYDALLDTYEPGATQAQLTPLFASLRESLSPIVKAVADSGVVIDESAARGEFPRDKQLEFGRRVAERMGFDFDAGRIDAAAHPFCSGFNPGDVRLAWRWLDDDFRSALYGIMHEAGHGLYEQGLPKEWERTPLCGAVSLGIHESQSRLWENLVGRSRDFWEWALPVFHELFPDKRGVSVDALYPALHTVAPSLIRVEADEATYNLHIVARYEVEQALISGELDVADLPEAWDQAYEDLLGIRAPSAADGFLQDIHWSMGAFGYFPTYTLGNLVSAQLFRSASKELGDLGPSFARGEFGSLLEWLRSKIHVHGCRFSATELVEMATGRPLSSEDFLDYIRETTAQAYGVTA